MYIVIVCLCLPLLELHALLFNVIQIFFFNLLVSEPHLEQGSNQRQDFQYGHVVRVCKLNLLKKFPLNCSDIKVVAKEYKN